MAAVVSLGYFLRMGIMRKAGAFGVAKMIYDQARKPQNQAKIKQAMQTAKERRNRGGAR